MERRRLFGLVLVLALLAALSQAAKARRFLHDVRGDDDYAAAMAAASSGRRSTSLAQGAIIIDHTCTDLSRIPAYWIERAKELAIHYAHTSHGSQIASGLETLDDSTYNFSRFYAGAEPPTSLSCEAGALCMYDGNPPETYITPEDYWSTPDGIDRTRSVADTGLFDTSMWSWCGQQSSNSTATVQQYLDTMAGFEAAYPDMRFILMTGHTDGGSSTLERNNDLVRQYAADNGMVLFDFADIETYDPLGGGPYDNNGEGTCTWCVDFCGDHPAYCTDLPSSCDHSETHPEDALFCKLKGNAFWWMMARLAGWEGQGPGADDYVFNAVVAPPNATEPVTYDWSPEPADGQGTPSATYHWAPGTYEIAVEATNCGGTVSAERTVTVGSSARNQDVASFRAEAPVARQTMTFQNGVSPDASYAGTTDATITTWSGNSYANLGGLDYLQVGEAGDADEFRLLVRFELGGWLPPSAWVDEARLELRAYDSGYDDDPQDAVAHGVVEEWVEGDGWDLEADGRSEGVTWTTARPGVNWATPGGDFDPTELDRVTVAANPDGWYRWDVTSAVRGWVSHGASNDGLLLEPDGAPWMHHQFHASEYGVATLRPRLVVTYTSDAPVLDHAVYLPLVVRNHTPQPPACPHPLTGVAISGPITGTPPSGGLIQPSDLAYRGAFRLPDSPGTPGNVGWAWSNWASAATYYPGGDPGGAADGYPGSLFGVGHDQTQHVSEVSVPSPVDSPGKNVSELNTAETLQGFHDVRGGIVGAMELPRVGLAYLPAQGSQIGGKLTFAWAPHLDEGATNPSHGWSELDLASPQSVGAWRIGDYWNYVTGDYLFEIPRAWADAHVSGRYLATGRYRDGGQGAEGPSLFAIAPWAAGDPPPPGSTLSATPLLLYGNAYEENPPAMDDYHHADEWTGGAWLTTGSKAAVVFVGNKGVGDCWYGCADGTDRPPWPGDCDRGWWSTGIVGQFRFYDPADLAAVAQGAMETWEPQPYATLDVDDVLYHVTSERQKYHRGGGAFDREGGVFFFFVRLGFGDTPWVQVGGGGWGGCGQVASMQICKCASVQVYEAGSCLTVGEQSRKSVDPSSQEVLDEHATTVPIHSIRTQSPKEESDDVATNAYRYVGRGTARDHHGGLRARAGA